MESALRPINTHNVHITGDVELASHFGQQLLPRLQDPPQTPFTLLGMQLARDLSKRACSEWYE